MKYLSYVERSFLRAHLNGVRHITLDPEGPGVVRIHLVPCKKATRGTPFVAILNGQDILPLDVSWSILLANLMEVLEPYTGQEVAEGAWKEISAKTVAATHKVYRRTPPEQIDSDLQVLLTTLTAVARGETPPVSVQPLSLGEYAPNMAAPHRMDLLVSSMQKDGAWHCNQKCLHCYAANQPYGATSELDTDQWLAVIEKCRAIGVPQLTFTGGEPTLRTDLVNLVQAAQWFVTRLNTNGRMLTSLLCKDLRAASLDSVQVTLYSSDEQTHNTLVGAAGYTDTMTGIKNALAAGLNVSLNTPLCSLNKDYLSTVQLAQELGIRYLSCSGLIPAGNAATDASITKRLSPAELERALRPALAFAAEHGMDISFTSPGWLSEATIHDLGLARVPSCGACLSNMAVAPDGTVLPCQSWLSGPGLGNLLRTPWPRIWNGAACKEIRAQSARMEQRCPLGATPMQPQQEKPL